MTAWMADSTDVHLDSAKFLRKDASRNGLSTTSVALFGATAYSL